MNNEQVTVLVEAIKAIGVDKHHDETVSMPSALQDISFALNGNQNSPGSNVTDGLFAIAKSIQNLANVLLEMNKNQSK